MHAQLPAIHADVDIFMFLVQLVPELLTNAHKSELAIIRARSARGTIVICFGARCVDKGSVFADQVVRE